MLHQIRKDTLLIPINRNTVWFDNSWLIDAETQSVNVDRFDGRAGIGQISTSLHFSNSLPPAFQKEKSETKFLLRRIQRTWGLDIAVNDRNVTMKCLSKFDVYTLALRNRKELRAARVYIEDRIKVRVAHRFLLLHSLILADRKTIHSLIRFNNRLNLSCIEHHFWGIRDGFPTTHLCVGLHGRPGMCKCQFGGPGTVRTPFLAKVSFCIAFRSWPRISSSLSSDIPSLKTLSDDSFQRISHPALPHLALRVKKTKFCDPSVEWVLIQNIVWASYETK